MLHIFFLKYATGVKKPCWVVGALTIYPASPSIEIKCLVYSILGTFFIVDKSSHSEDQLVTTEHI